MAEVPELVDFRDKNDLREPDVAFEFVKKISLSIEEGNLSFSDKEFLDYILDIKHELDYEQITTGVEIPEFADFPDIDSYKKTIEGITQFKPTLLSALFIYNAERGDQAKAEEFFEKLVKELDIESKHDTDIEDNDESQNRDNTTSGKATFALLPYFRSRIALENPYDPSYPSLEETVELALDAMNLCDDHYLIRVNYAKAVAHSYEDDLEFKHEIGRIPSDQEKLVNNAINIVEGAIVIREDYGPAHAAQARLYALKGELQDSNISSNFEKAKAAIKRAIELEDEEIETSASQRRENNRIQREIRLREQTATTRRQVTEAANEVENLKSDLQQTVDRYRRNTLSFIGFFAALITLAVTSIQILSAEGGTLTDRATLIIVQAGALVFAFGAFGLLLPALKSTNSNSRKWIDNLTLRGLLLVAIGFSILYIVSENILVLPT